MPKRTSKTSDITLVEVIAERLLGESQSEIAKEYGVSTKPFSITRQKRPRRIAETVGDALGEQALEQLAIRKHDKPDNEAGAPSGNFDCSANHG